MRKTVPHARKSIKRAVKKVTEQREANRGQRVSQEDALRLDLALRLSPETVYYIEALAAYYGISRQELAVQLLEVAVQSAAERVHSVGDPLEMEVYVEHQEAGEYARRQLDAMRQNWRTLATLQAPPQREK